jgi:D-glycero-alpha-D-manno-heptose-7-phosphate kinase
VRHFGARGVEVRTRSDSPVGAGIAGSSAKNIALAAALAAWTGRTVPDEELLAIAMNVEAQVIGVPTGVQDYRPALFGGVAALDLGLTGVHRTALDVDLGELDRRIVLAYTGASRQSGINNWEVMKRRIDGDLTVGRAFDGIRDAAAGVREALVREDWPAVAVHLDAEWSSRKRLAPGVATPAIETTLARARAAGALAGKVCGAGGGGCLFCLVPPERHGPVAAALGESGARVLPFQFEREGLKLVRH